MTIQHRPLAKLGHTDSMFNLAVSSELLHNGKLPGERAELLRVLRPSGGALALGGLPQSGLAKLISDSALARGTTAEASGELLLARRKALLQRPILVRGDISGEGPLEACVGRPKSRLYEFIGESAE